MQSISKSVVHSSTVRYFHIAEIFIRLVIVFFYFSLMCCLKLSCWSRNPPRYLTTLHISRRSPWELSGSGDIFLSCAWHLKRIYSVLSEFNLRCIVSIQDFISLNTSSRSALVCCSLSLLAALKLLQIEWSSANPLSVMELLIWSSISEQLQVK